MCDQLNDDFLREDCNDFYTCVFVIGTSDLEVEFGSRIKVQEEITSPKIAIIMQTWRFCHVQFLYGVTCMCIHNYRIIAYSPPTSTVQQQTIRISPFFHCTGPACPKIFEGPSGFT